jgi:hypothetical protein
MQPFCIRGGGDINKSHTRLRNWNPSFLAADSIYWVTRTLIVEKSIPARGKQGWWNWEGDAE